MPIGSMRFAIRAEYVCGLRRSKAVFAAPAKATDLRLGGRRHRVPERVSVIWKGASRGHAIGTETALKLAAQPSRSAGGSRGGLDRDRLCCASDLTGGTKRSGSDAGSRLRLKVPQELFVSSLHSKIHDFASVLFPHKR